MRAAGQKTIFPHRRDTRQHWDHTDMEKGDKGAGNAVHKGKSLIARALVAFLAGIASLAAAVDNWEKLKKFFGDNIFVAVEETTPVIKDISVEQSATLPTTPQTDPPPMCPEAQRRPLDFFNCAPNKNRQPGHIPPQGTRIYRMLAVISFPSGRSIERCRWEGQTAHEGNSVLYTPFQVRHVHLSAYYEIELNSPERQFTITGNRRGQFHDRFIALIEPGWDHSLRFRVACFSNLGSMNEMYYSDWFNINAPS